jgi:hypothetical protein
VLRPVFLGSVLSLSCACVAQQSAPEPSSSRVLSGTTNAGATQPLDSKRAQLKADSEKLAKAAAELKALLAKTNADQLSLDVIKKAEEVQRLAKQVQREMKEQ